MQLLPHSTERLSFRTWTAADWPLALALWGNPQVTRLIADLGFPSEQQAHERLVREFDNLTEYGIQYWPIFLRDGTHLGCCGLRPYLPDEPIEEIGIHLRPAFWRQGFATEALSSVIRYAFAVRNVKALFARHHPDNVGSGRVLSKLGFRYTHDELMTQTGLFHPCYELLAQTP
jgi:ribosomal-protein-alanine N-acetyltransferase